MIKSDLIERLLYLLDEDIDPKFLSETFELLRNIASDESMSERHPNLINRISIKVQSYLKNNKGKKNVGISGMAELTRSVSYF